MSSNDLVIVYNNKIKQKLIGCLRNYFLYSTKTVYAQLNLHILNLIKNLHFAYNIKKC